MLLAAVDRKIGLYQKLAACFTDHRLTECVHHALPDLLRQRIFGVALGHEELIDHDQLRFDPALTAVLNKPTGVLAGKSTLNRLEHAGKVGRDRQHKLDVDAQHRFAMTTARRSRSCSSTCSSRPIRPRRPAS